VTGGKGPVSPADKPLKTPAREPPNERKGAIGLLEVGIELKYSPDSLLSKIGFAAPNRGFGFSPERALARRTSAASAFCRPAKKPEFERNRYVWLSI